MTNNADINFCTLMSLPKLHDERGNLSFLENSIHIPFNISRIYYLYDVPENQERGGHAHKELSQAIIAISGSFDITLNDGFNRKKINLSRPDQALYVCPMIWRDLGSFSKGAVCMVLASHKYDEQDYIHNYESYIEELAKS